MAKLRVKVTAHADNPACDHVLTGFALLHRAGTIDLDMHVHADLPAEHPSPSLVRASLEGGTEIAYDVEDGYIIDWESRNRFLETVDLCFKRSFHAELHASSPFASRFRPLGLTYHATGRHVPVQRVRRYPKHHAKWLVKRALRREASSHWSRFEHAPHVNERPSVLFAARLWDPRGESGEHIEDREAARVEREALNHMRAECVRRLRSEFGPAFRGGLVVTPYARERYPDCIAPRSVTDRRAFLSLVERSDICVATRGLAGSNGYKLGEYVAASRAVVSESLLYTVPGDFDAGRNYLPFDTAEDCVKHVAALLADPPRVHRMQTANYGYYHRYVRPDRMVLNTLLVALEDMEPGPVPGSRTSPRGGPAGTPRRESHGGN